MAETKLHTLIEADAYIEEVGSPDPARAVQVLLDEVAALEAELAAARRNLNRSTGTSRRTDDPDNVWVRYPEDAWDELRTFALAAVPAAEPTGKEPQ
jgi:hypothetical protein